MKDPMLPGPPLLHIVKTVPGGEGWVSRTILKEKREKRYFWTPKVVVCLRGRCVKNGGGDEICTKNSGC